MSDESDGRSEWWSHPITNSGGMIGPGGQEISNGGAVGPNAGPAIPSQGFPDGRPAKSVDGPQPDQGQGFPNDGQRPSAGNGLDSKAFQSKWAGLSGGAKGSIVAAAVVAAILSLATVALVGRALFGGSEERSEREYAKGLCREVVEPFTEEIEALVDDAPNFGLSDTDPTERELERYREWSLEFLNRMQKFMSRVGGYNEDYVLPGSRGEDFQEDMRADIEQILEEFDSAVSAAKEVDLSDEENAVEDLRAAFDEPSVFNDGRVLGELSALMNEHADNCGSDLFG